MFDFIQMQKKLLFLIAFICVGSAYAQVTCPSLNGPFDGDIDVPMDTSSHSGNMVKCASRIEFSVVASEIVTITSLDTSGLNGSSQITARVTGNGDYEFTLVNSDGPYQDCIVFAGLPSGSYTVYIRDKDGCGLVEESIIQDLILEGFPNYFSPNGDGIHDFWQFSPPPDIDINIEIIHFYDRYGNFVAQLDPKRIGWDGSFNGRPLLATDYWFKVKSFGQKKTWALHTQTLARVLNQTAHRFS